MLANTNTITRFYSAFARLDAKEMATCYAPDARFDDPAFSLAGRDEIGGMWAMLCDATKAKGQDAWRLEFSSVQADKRGGSAHWEAHYRFSATGRLVHNTIEAQFAFDADNLIKRHQDDFPFWRWSRQALGAPGLLLGWTPFLRNKVRATAAASLKKYLAAKGKA